MHDAPIGRLEGGGAHGTEPEESISFAQGRRFAALFVRREHPRTEDEESR